MLYFEDARLEFMGVPMAYLPYFYTPDPTVKPTEPPWLSREATGQLIGEDAMPGPLFAGLVLGGPAPTAEQKTRIAEFARKNHLDLYLDVANDKLVAIRLDISYGGCCGYEGADALGLRLQRAKTQDCLDCTWSGWLDDWTRTSEDYGLVLRAAVRVNRVKARWERALTEGELYERAEALIGQDYEALGKAEGERWHELVFEHDYLLEVPYPLDPFFDRVHSGIPLADRRDLGLHLTLERRKVVEVTFHIRNNDEARNARTVAAAKKRWGRSHDGEWRLPGRTITACCENAIEEMTIRKQ